MSRPRVTRGPIDDIAATVADLSSRLRNLETVGHRHPATPYLPENSPRVYRTTSQTIATGVLTTMSWQAVDDTTWGAWVVGSPTLLTAPITGRYFATSAIRWIGNVTGYRSLAIVRSSDAAILASVQYDTLAAAVVTTRQVVVTPAFTLAAGDSIICQVFQNSGGNLDVQVTAGDIGPSMSLILLA